MEFLVRILFSFAGAFAGLFDVFFVSVADESSLLSAKDFY
jgi:hypothetical protein